MKPYTTPVLEVTLDIPVETVASIKFLFKQEDKQEAATLLLKKYPDEIKCEDGIYKIPFTQAETDLFAQNQYFYLDMLVTDQTGKIPRTPILSLFMSKTLFTYEEAVAK